MTGVFLKSKRKLHTELDVRFTPAVERSWQSDGYVTSLLGFKLTSNRLIERILYSVEISGIQ